VPDVGQCVISGFCREVDENCYLLSHYAAYSGDLLLMFQDNLSVPHSRGKPLEGETDRLSQNVGKK